MPDQAAPVRVMVVDDHPLWRDAVVADLRTAGFEVVATAATGAEAVVRARATRPALLVLDLQIPAPDGVEVTARMVAEDPSLRVLVLSASGEQADVLEAVKAGATGYLVKSASRAELLDAARRVAAGDTVFTAGLAGLVLGEFRRLSDGPAGGAAAPQLTERETEVLRLVAKGLSYRQIAERLVLSHRTVQNHVQNTLRKLQLHNRVQLARYAIEQGARRVSADSLFEVAHELYALAPEEFTLARDAASRKARDDGDRALARDVKALRRPAPAAWAVNLLTRERADLVLQVLDLGRSMREAQALLQGAELRDLGRQRRQLVAAVAAQARALAAEAGHRLTDAALRQVEETLHAAMADQEAAAAVRSGVLAQPLSSTGVSSLGAALAVPPRDLPAAPAAGVGGATLVAVPDDEEMVRERRLEEARARAEEAAASARRAGEERDRARNRRAKREAKVLQHQAELEELHRRVAETEHARDRAADRLAEATEELAISESAYESARRGADEAAAALRELR